MFELVYMFVLLLQGVRMINCVCFVLRYSVNKNLRKSLYTRVYVFYVQSDACSVCFCILQSATTYWIYFHCQRFFFIILQIFFLGADTRFTTYSQLVIHCMLFIPQFDKSLKFPVLLSE